MTSSGVAADRIRRGADGRGPRSSGPRPPRACAIPGRFLRPSPPRCHRAATRGREAVGYARGARERREWTALPAAARRKPEPQHRRAARAGARRRLRRPSSARPRGAARASGPAEAAPPAAPPEPAAAPLRRPRDGSGARRQGAGRARPAAAPQGPRGSTQGHACAAVGPSRSLEGLAGFPERRALPFARAVSAARVYPSGTRPRVAEAPPPQQAHLARVPGPLPPAGGARERAPRRHGPPPHPGAACRPGMMPSGGPEPPAYRSRRRASPYPSHDGAGRGWCRRGAGFGRGSSRRREIGARRRARREVAPPRGPELPGPEPGALSVGPRKRRHGRHELDAPLPGWSRGRGHMG